MAQSQCVCLRRRPKYWRVLRRRRCEELSIRKSRPQRAPRSQFHLERFLPHQAISFDRTSKDALRHPVFQRIQSSQFRAAYLRKPASVIPLDSILTEKTGRGALALTSTRVLQEDRAGRYAKENSRQIPNLRP